MILLNAFVKSNKATSFHFIVALSIFLFSQITPLLFAEDNAQSEIFDSSLLRTQSLLSTVVDSVSVISGEWVQSEADFVVIGPEPLVLSRGYSVDRLSGKKLGCNWDFQHPHPFHWETIVRDYEHGEFKHGGIIKAHLVHGPGIATGYKTEFSSKKEMREKVVNLFLDPPRGTTNCSSGEISARTNPHNTVLQLDRNKRTCSVFTGSGQETCYQLDAPKDFKFKDHFTGKENTKDRFIPLYDKKPNGNLFLFKENTIASVNPSLKVCYGTIEIEEPDEHSVLVKTSDGKKGKYSFSQVPCFIKQKKKIKGSDRYTITKSKITQKCLKKVTFSHKPWESYEYTDNQIPLLLAKRSPQNHFQMVEYYNVGANFLKGLKKISLGEEDCRLNRIKAVLRPVGIDCTPIITHQFIYEMYNSGGKTIVYDAYLRKTAYTYNAYHRPISVERFKGEKVYSAEKYIWDDHYEYKQNPEICEDPLIPKQKRRNGNLIGKYIQGKEGSIQHARFFDYDSRGNILKERFYGNLTGRNTIPILIDEQHLLQENGAEYTQKTYTYSDDRFNLILSELEDNGKGVLYTYLPKTDLVTAKYITENGSIRFREFYFYDRNRSLIRLVKDDGSSRDESKLDQVTERHVTRYYPRKSPPFGLPEKVEELYWEAEQGEILNKRVICEYSKEGYLTKQDHYDAKGDYAYSLEWKYDAHGNLIKETNALGQSVSKEYDENDNLILEDGFGVVKRYFYDCVNRLTREEVTQSSGGSYAISHRYDYIGNKSATIDRFGNETRFEYDDFNRLVKTCYPPLQDYDGSVTYPETSIEYDAADHPILTIDPCGLSTKAIYNVLGKPLKIQHPDKTVDRYVYYLDGTLANSISPTGVQTQFKRDFLGRTVAEEIYDEQNALLGTKSYVYQGNHLISQTNCEGEVVTLSYDGAGRIKTETHGDAFKSYEYDTLGRLAKSTDCHGFGLSEKTVKTYRYDKLNRIIEERIEDGEGSPLQHLLYAYDERGNVCKKWRNTQAGESSIVVTYDSEDRPLSETNAEGETTHTVYEDGHINALGQRILRVIKTDAKGRNTTQIFDAMGRVREITLTNAFGILLSQQHIDYNASGQQIRTVDAVIVEGNIERHYINTWSYHPSGQVERLVEASGSPEQRMTLHFFNSLSQKRKTVKPDGVTIRHHYDSQGRLKTLFSSDHTVFYSFEYDRNHRLRKVSDLLTSTSTDCHYDEKGHLTQEKLANGLQLNYQYDRTGRPIQIELPDGSYINYIYHSPYLKEVQRKKGEAILYKHEYSSYDQSGALLSSKLIGNSENVSYTYDRIGRPIHSEHAARTQKASYDLLGRLESMEIQDKVGSIKNPYGYDEMDHLASENGNVYQTDSLHNRISKNNDPYLINELNQLKEKNGCQYKYDLNGNLIQKIEKGQTTLYSYDALNRLTGVASLEGVISYQYDGFNRRISKIVDGIKTNFLYQGQNEIGSVSSTGEIAELRILGSGPKGEIGSAVAFELQGKVFAPLYDMTGDVAALIDSTTGELAEIYRYTAFGEESIYDEKGEKRDHSLIGNPWRFSSKRVDPETGWVYFGMRYYDPDCGRWTTTDPALFADGANLYAYLHHSPLMTCDVYGLYEEGYAYRESRDVALNAGNVVCSSTPVNGTLCYVNENHYEWNDRKGPGERNSASYERTDANGNLGTAVFSEAPAGFVEKPCEKSDRIFFVGNRQHAGLVITSVNGIMNSFNESLSSPNNISEIARDHLITHVYNRSTGFIVFDLIRCFAELFFHVRTEAVRNLQDTFTAAYSTLAPDGKILHFCHSEGAIVTRNALKGLPEHIRQGIIVVAFNPGGYIEDKYAFQVTHYRSEVDIVSKLDVVGRWKCRESTISLKPHPNASRYDHGMNSETFNDAKAFELDQYFNQYGGSTCV